MELQILKESADVVMTLDIGRTLTPTGLNDVSIERALDEELHLPRLANYLTSRCLEGPDEFPTNDLAFLLWISHSGQR